MNRRSQPTPIGHAQKLYEEEWDARDDATKTRDVRGSALRSRDGTRMHIRKSLTSRRHDFTRAPWNTLDVIHPVFNEKHGLLSRTHAVIMRHIEKKVCYERKKIWTLRVPTRLAMT